MLDDPLRSLAIPFGRNRTFSPLPCHQLCQRRRELARIGPDEFVGADHDGLGTFGVVAQRENWLLHLGYLVGLVCLIDKTN